jgi:transposase
MAKKKRNQLTKREYEKLKQTAYEYIVAQGLDQKEVAKILHLTETTISKWANQGKEGKWKDLRETRMQCQSTDADNIKKLIQILSKQR